MPSGDEPNSVGATVEEAGPPPPRVFVALKIAPDLAQTMFGLSAAFAGLAVRRIPAADIHLTLVRPWREGEIAAAVGRLAGVATRHTPFELAFQHVGYGPQPQRPRLLWVECVPNDALAVLHADLLAALGQSDERPFRPHVTLARIRGNGAAIARKVPIDRALVLAQQVVSVELMRSPPPGGAGYTVLASVPLDAVATAALSSPV